MSAAETGSAAAAGAGPGRDLVVALREAVARAGDGWANQPSLLKRRLDDVLAEDAVALRPKVHLLVVAAEERVPSRLTRSQPSPALLAEVAAELADTRGWTAEAATWSVAVWAQALEVGSVEPAPPPGAR